MGAEPAAGVQQPEGPAGAGGEGDTRGGAPGVEGTPPAAEAAPAAPVEYGPGNSHPESIAARIDQLEQLGQNRTPEQETQLQQLHQEREAADQASPEYTAKAQQLDQLNTQISTLEGQVAKSEARKNNAIAPSRSLLAQRAQLETLRRQRDTVQGDIQTMGPTEARNYNEAVHGPPEDRAVVPGTSAEAGTTGPLHPRRRPTRQNSRFEPNANDRAGSRRPQPIRRQGRDRRGGRQGHLGRGGPRRCACAWWRALRPATDRPLRASTPAERSDSPCHRNDRGSR